MRNIILFQKSIVKRCYILFIEATEIEVTGVVVDELECKCKLHAKMVHILGEIKAQTVSIEADTIIIDGTVTS
jgi:hypothetical protein